MWMQKEDTYHGADGPISQAPPKTPILGQSESDINCMVDEDIQVYYESIQIRKAKLAASHATALVKDGLTLLYKIEKDLY